MTIPIILASGSVYRRELLQRLQLEFSQVSPDVDETPLMREKPADLVQRLAKDKALAVANTHVNALIIGSDQVAVVEDFILTKPGDRANAIQQLQRCSGKAVELFTGMCLLNSQTKAMQLHVEQFTIYFRKLTETMINHYLDKDLPFDCAGSVKVESLGIALFTHMQGNDPTSIQGLPLIKLINMLENEGITVL